MNEALDEAIVEALILIKELEESYFLFF